MLDYSIIIATRNRVAALRLSIPRMLTQSRPPSQLIVVDSSDDHEAVVEVVKACAEGHRIDLVIVNSERGLTKQRNIGLKHVTKPVVFFPDDDSIWFPDTAEAQMLVYERDDLGRIAAVCAAESSVPPPDWELSTAATYQMTRRQRFQQRIAATRSKIEGRLFPDPAGLLGKSFWPPSSALPPWFAEDDVVLVPWMTGFRMSFRTEVIRQVRFDENLTRYSLFEDVDASFGAWKLGWVVGARKARVYHYRSPERRDEGRRLGAHQLLNKAYIIHKHSSPGHVARARFDAFACYKLFQYRVGAVDAFGRERYNGAVAARAAVKRISASNIAIRPELFLDALEEIV